MEDVACDALTAPHVGAMGCRGAEPARRYVTYRTIKGYYDDGDALDMRKSLPADRNNKRMEPRDKSWNLQSFMVPG